MSYKYNTYYYWESQLSSNKDVWKCNNSNKEDLRKSVYVNTTILDYKKNILDNNWACYPDIKSLLGFIQYVFIPTAFFHILLEDNEDIFIPVCSIDEFLSYIKDKNYDEKTTKLMEENINELKKIWYIDDLSIDHIKKFCNYFNSSWINKSRILYLKVFSNPNELAYSIIANQDFIEVFEEDIGLTKNQFCSFCKNAYSNKFTKSIFIEFLNNKIGCVV